MIGKKEVVLRERSGKHKGQNGRVLIIGGSEKYIGAPALAGLAALRAGCDLVTIAAPEKVAYAINSISPDLITSKLKGDFIAWEHIHQLINLSLNNDVVLIGNGLGTEPETMKVVAELVKRIQRPLVLDADALRAKITPQHCVLTPHKEEFNAYLANMGKNYVNANEMSHEELAEFARRQAGTNIFVVKGEIDVIARSEEFKLNSTGNNGMTVGGTGDVLAGIIASLIAQGNEPWQAAITGTYVNGAIGDHLLKTMGYGFLATDMINNIPSIMKTIKRMK